MTAVSRGATWANLPEAVGLVLAEAAAGETPDAWQGHVVTAQRYIAYEVPCENLEVTRAGAATTSG